MKKYLNLKTHYGVETVDELDSSDFKTYKEFREELKRLLYEYHLSGQNAYISIRACKEWRE